MTCAHHWLVPIAATRRIDDRPIYRATCSKCKAEREFDPESKLPKYVTTAATRAANQANRSTMVSW